MEIPNSLPSAATGAAVGVGDGLGSCWHRAPLAGRKRNCYVKDCRLSDLPLCETIVGLNKH